MSRHSKGFVSVAKILNDIAKAGRKWCKDHRICNNMARQLLGTITHVLTKDLVAALTFDDGPNPVFTPRLLDILKKHEAKGTFFMVGEAAKKYPELVRNVAAAQHTIANHSYSHLSFSEISRLERKRQMLDCQRAIAPYGLRLFRPPHGHQNVSSRVDALWLRFKVIGWSVAVRDWTSHDVDWMVDQLIDQVQPGSIVLLHDSLFTAKGNRFLSRDPMLEAVDRFLDKIGNKMSFVTLPELFKEGRIIRQNWYRGVAI